MFTRSSAPRWPINDPTLRCASPITTPIQRPPRDLEQGAALFPLTAYHVLDPSSTLTHTTLTPPIRWVHSQPHFTDEGNKAHRGPSCLVTCCRDTSRCLLTLSVINCPCPSATPVAALDSAFLTAAQPHQHLGTPPGHLLARGFQTPPMVTFWLSCWFSLSSSLHLRLLFCSARDVSCSPWMVLWRLWLSSSFRMLLEVHSFSSNSDFLEAEVQSRVRTQIPGASISPLCPRAQDSHQPKP